MSVFFPIYAVIVLFIFNLLAEKICLTLDIEQVKRAGTFRMINALVLILLVSSYLKILNSTV